MLIDEALKTMNNFGGDKFKMTHFKFHGDEYAYHL